LLGFVFDAFAIPLHGPQKYKLAKRWEKAFMENCQKQDLKNYPNINFMKYSALFFAAFLFGCNFSEKQKQKIIKVCGEGKIRVKPNLVILTIDVSFTKARMADAVRLTQETVDSVLIILQQFGNRNDDIKTSSISANKDYDYAGRSEKFVGYKAEQSIDFVLNDLQQFTALTGKLLETKISSISQIQFGHSRSDSLFREADLLAYDDALKSASKLCNRAAVTLGKLISMTNTVQSNNYDPETYSSGEQINTYSKVLEARGFKISPEVLEFRRAIVSEYEITN
jgi:uncharacterized protein YggE